MIAARQRSVRRRRQKRRGAIALLAAVLIGVLLIAAAISVDIAYMQYTRSELRAATDAAARAAGEALSRTEDTTIARNAAKNAALQNNVGGKPLALDDQQIVFGNSREGDDGRWSFVPNAEPYNSVQVRGARTESTDAGEVELFFGGLLGTRSFAPEFHAAVVKGDFVQRDFAVVVDRSGSMNGRAGYRQSKWQALLTALSGFFAALDETRDEEKVGLASYSNNSSVEQWLEDNYNVTQSALSRIRVRGSTNIHSGIMSGRAILNDAHRHREETKKIMVVMTDGQHNTGSEPILAANLAARDGIEIYTITFGNGADTRRMIAVANATGGKHYHAPSPAALKEVFLQVVQDSAGIHFVQ